MANSARKTKAKPKGKAKKSGGPGGKRPGAGRPKGRLDIATYADKVELANETRKYAPKIIRQLVRIATKSKSDSARLAACNLLLERGYGKAPQTLEHGGKDGGPIDIRVTHRIVDPAQAVN